MLSAVALLGDAIPGVSNLKDILDLYGVKDFQSIKSYEIESDAAIVKTYSVNGENKTMPQTPKELELEREIDKLKADKAKSDDDVKKFKADAEGKTEFEKKFEASEKARKEAEGKVADSEKAKGEAEKETFMKSLETDLKITNSMKPYVLALIGEEKKEYSIEKKNFSKQDLVKELLKLYKNLDNVNEDDDSEEGDKQNQSNEAALEKKIAKYEIDHKCSYKEAYVAVSNEEAEKKSA